MVCFRIPIVEGIRTLLNNFFDVIVLKYKNNLYAITVIQSYVTVGSTFARYATEATYNP